MTVANAAILYEPGAFESGGPALKGRHVAGASFLEGFVRHADVDTFFGVGLRDEFAAPFEARLAELQAALTPERIRPAKGLRQVDFATLGQVGTFFCPDPGIGQHAWRRRHVGQRSYSLCGITHTIASKAVQQALADYMVAPLQDWDALICTSSAVRDAVVRIQGAQGDYLEARIGSRPPQPAQLPVIPLGTDVETYAARGDDGNARADLRRRLGVGEGDVLVLFLGRLAFHAKAHPAPMFAALQRARQQLPTGGPALHFLMTGQFANVHQEDAFRTSAARACPDVPVHFIDGTPGPESWASWAAADIFLSLSDNIQESFGITPVEAMAAGLPCVVSDWDGYRDTVVDGETGYRVQSWIGPELSGAGLARSYDLGTLTYDRFIGAASLATSVDVDETAAAILRLAESVELRRALGEAGRRRARVVYDWSAIIPQYQALWTDLADRRRFAQEIAPPAAAAMNPALGDPTATFGGFSTHRLDGATRVRGAEPNGRQAVEALFTDSTATFQPGILLTKAEIQDLVERVGSGPVAVDDLLAGIAEDQRGPVLRSILWLAKFGVLSLHGDR